MRDGDKSVAEHLFFFLEQPQIFIGRLLSAGCQGCRAEGTRPLPLGSVWSSREMVQRPQKAQAGVKENVKLKENTGTIRVRSWGTSLRLGVYKEVSRSVIES